jgi:hypothetical protein
MYLILVESAVNTGLGLRTSDRTGAEGGASRPTRALFGLSSER